MNIIKIILGIIFLILSIGCVKEMISGREDGIIYFIFGFITILTSTILILDL